MHYIELLVRAACQTIKKTVPQQQADRMIADIGAIIERSNRRVRGEE